MTQLSQLSIQTKDSDVVDTNNILNSTKVGTLTSVGIYKGQLVAIKSIPKLMGELTRNDLMELKEVMYALFLTKSYFPDSREHGEAMILQ